MLAKACTKHIFKLVSAMPIQHFAFMHDTLANFTIKPHRSSISHRSFTSSVTEGCSAVHDETTSCMKHVLCILGKVFQSIEWDFNYAETCCNIHNSHCCMIATYGFSILLRLLKGPTWTFNKTPTQKKQDMLKAQPIFLSASHLIHQRPNLPIKLSFSQVMVRKELVFKIITAILDSN